MRGLPELGALARAAAAGDQRAWDSLVTRFRPLMRAIARRYRLSPPDQDDVEQRTWLALIRHIDGLVAPEALAGWLATTARNESLAMLRAARRELPVDELPSADPRHTPKQTEEVMEAELRSAARASAVRRAVERTSGRERAMLEMLMAQAPASYAEISTTLKMPVGSIGPTRARSLARLRRDPQIASLLDDCVRPMRPTRPPRLNEPDTI